MYVLLSMRGTEACMELYSSAVAVVGGGGVAARGGPHLVHL